jgi:hypothetical protein
VWYSLPAVSSNAGEAKSGIGVDMMVRGKGGSVIDVALVIDDSA